MTGSSSLRSICGALVLFFVKPIAYFMTLLPRREASSTRSERLDHLLLKKAKQGVKVHVLGRCLRCAALSAHDALISMA